MADGDSLHDVCSDLDKDSSDVEADAEDEEASETSLDAMRKKSKKKKRKPKDTERSSGDSDNQITRDEAHDSRNILLLRNERDNSPSGVEADSEGQTSTSQSTKNAVPDQKSSSHICNEAHPDKHAKSPDMCLSSEKLDTKPMKLEIQKIQRALAEINNQAQGTPKNLEEAGKKRYKFWETQPVPRLSDKVLDNSWIEGDKPVGEVRQNPYTLPEGFHWDTLDISNPLVLTELYSLLNENYVEDDDNMFRFDYSSSFLQWALQPPGWQQEWHCGVRITKSLRLVGFISAIPIHLKIYDKRRHMVEINFLCVHKKLRSNRMAPVLIKEITRRVNKHGLFQAVYTAGVVLPKPVACCRYWHRSLNPRKLIEVKFSHLSRHMTMQRMIKLHKLPDSPKCKGFRPITLLDVESVQKLLNQYLQRFDIAPIYELEEFKHWFLPRPDIIDSYVVEHNGRITDFVSFYTLRSTVMQHPVHKDLKAAYSFYNVSTRTDWVDLINDTLITAKNLGFDVFNALDLMDNKSFLETCKFGIGDGYLQYYLYNWKCPPSEPGKIGLVLQ